jgi:UDP-N-acetyl-D-glucosamine dehydrogenase
MNVLVMGQGYVGLPLAMEAVKSGHTVTGYDPSVSKILQIQKASSPVEDVSDEMLTKALRGTWDGFYNPISREDLIGRADVVVICVPTPLTKGQPDLSYIESATRIAGYRALHKGTTVILESTTHPGTTRNTVVPILEGFGRKAGVDFHVGFSPERIDPGNKWHHFGNTMKLVSGLTEACATAVQNFYQSMLVPTHRMASLENAEMAKILENTYRHVNIALVNELTRVAHTLGIDMWDVIQGASTKPYGFQAFYPGPGVGGHCLPVDPVYLSHLARTELGQTLHLMEWAQEVNRQQPAYVVQRLMEHFNEKGHALKGARVLALGLAYKPNTGDMRESPATEVVDLLRAKGAKVISVEPYAATRRHQDDIKQLPVELRFYDAVVVLTPHDSIDLQRVADEAHYVLDTRGVMPAGDNIERL